jgi:hypothetical protein
MQRTSDTVTNIFQKLAVLSRWKLLGGSNAPEKDPQTSLVEEGLLAKVDRTIRDE